MLLDFDCGFCQKDHLFGGRGICDILNETCLCEEGFSGKDDWMSFSGCQVNESLRENIHLVLVVEGVVGLLVSVYYLFLMLKKWKFRLFSSSTTAKLILESPSTDPQSESEPTQSFFHPPMILHKPSLQEAAVKNWKRKVLSVYSAISLGISFASSIWYHALLLDGENREDNKVKVVVSFYFLVAGSFMSAMLGSAGWFYLLPDLSRYGKFLQMNSFLVKYPEFIPRTFFTNLFLIQVSFLFGIVIIPLSTDNDEIIRLGDFITFCTSLYYFTFMGFIWLITIVTVKNIFAMVIRTFQKQVDSSRQNLFFNSERKREVKLMKKLMNPINGIFCSSMFAHIMMAGFQIWILATGITQLYIIFNIVLVGSIFLLGQPVFLYQMDEFLVSTKLKQNDEPPPAQTY